MAADDRKGELYKNLRTLVLHRDGDTCQLCGITCTTSGNYNHNDYASLDHITPLRRARNAEHRKQLLLDPLNCRIVCRGCNQRRKHEMPVTNPLPGWG